MQKDCPELSTGQAQEAIRWIRDAYGAVFRGQDPPDLAGGVWDEPGCPGVFVTLWTHPEGDLRGCIGVLERRTLGEQIQWSALQAAFNDPRFPPLSARELPNIKIELSLLHSFEHVSPEEAPHRLQPGVHGVVLSLGLHRGLLLPEVAETIHARTGEDMLRAVALKAGLPPDAWESPHASIQLFKTRRFMETVPGGPVEEVPPDEPERP